ncbi:hypothetical protein [Luteimonas vadosa]|uniref:Phasin family protein n=1 Tax=Luteimonas vadosa TaxID=1165507 RepID=A0ABP9E1N6_9GAMM
MSRSRRTTDTTSQLAALSWRAPYVATQRLMRMAGPVQSAADRRELARMGTEKLSAMQEGWMAMAMQVIALQQHAWSSLMQAAWSPWFSASMPSWPQALADADAVVAAGLRPATRQVAANARRLSRRR